MSGFLPVILPAQTALVIILPWFTKGQVALLLSDLFDPTYFDYYWNLIEQNRQIFSLYNFNKQQANNIERDTRKQAQ